MDEMLFISMAKLGAQRLHEERTHRLFNEPAICSASGSAQSCHVSAREPARGRPERPSGLAALSGSLAVVLTLLIALAAVSNWYSERIAAPPGEVYVTELGASATPETRVAQGVASSATRR